ncbi:metalloendopeptidase [Dorcoceras hygrometricum]|uniref:Metalloendopeptidase n=1 Tax=Dorcoceras hygrometricum TaxID=472368 RepID=A0A2Z7BMB7_9LAMI|nr:metalloendopeptidase [Dorcoceras hygrometricum]
MPGTTPAATPNGPADYLKKPAMANTRSKQGKHTLSKLRVPRLINNKHSDSAGKQQLKHRYPKHSDSAGNHDSVKDSQARRLSQPINNNGNQHTYEGSLREGKSPTTPHGDPIITVGSRVYGTITSSSGSQGVRLNML